MGSGARSGANFHLEGRDEEKQSVRDLIPLFYDELRNLAHHRLAAERDGHTLNTTALVHELWLRLEPAKGLDIGGRAQFISLCGQVMRHILVDYARARLRVKRGGSAKELPIECAYLVSEERSADLIALDEALGSLSLLDPRKARVVELRYFGGLTAEETALALGVSQETVHRDWRLAKLWLAREIGRKGQDG